MTEFVPNLRIARFIPQLMLFMLLGCSPSSDQALGTLEWDRVSSRAPASEVILDILVEEGDRVEAGDLIMLLDNRKITEQINEQEARLEQATWFLKELEKGPRAQKIAEAEARLRAAEATLENDTEIYNRQRKLYRTDVTSKQQLDITKNNFLNAKERVKEYTEQLNELLEGTRIEQVKQAGANIAALSAQLKRLKLISGEFEIRATRAGVIDSLPFKKGDRPPAQAVICTLLAGSRPWARVYVPATYRSKMKPGDDFLLRIDGQIEPFSARLSAISSEASFTPYYALSDRDRSRLSYIAKLDLLDEKATELTAGTPVQLVLEGM